MRKVILTSKPMLPHLNSGKAADVYDLTAKTFWPMVGTANQSAYDAVTDAYDVIDEAGLMRRDVKKHCNESMKSFENYLRQGRLALGDRYYLWSDMTVNASAGLKDDVERLRYSIELTLQKNKVTDARLRSYVFLAQAMVDMSVMIFDTLMEEAQKQTAWDITSSFMPARMGAVKRAWGAVAEHFGRTEGMIDLNKNENCQIGMKVILTKYQTMDFMDSAAHKALRYNPDMTKYLTEEERRAFL